MRLVIVNNTPNIVHVPRITYINENDIGNEHYQFRQRSQSWASKVCNLGYSWAAWKKFEHHNVIISNNLFQRSRKKLQAKWFDTSFIYWQWCCWRQMEYQRVWILQKPLCPITKWIHCYRSFSGTEKLPQARFIPSFKAKPKLYESITKKTFEVNLAFSILFLILMLLQISWRQNWRKKIWMEDVLIWKIIPTNSKLPS